MKKRKILKSVVNFAISIIFLLISLIGQLMLKGYSPSHFTFNPDEKIKELAAAGEFTKGFSNDEFRIYYVNNGKEITPYAFVKIFGIWMLDYPKEAKFFGVSFGKKAAYYYGKFALNDEYDFIENSKGDKIYANKTKVGKHTFSVYQIPRSEENLCYRFVDADNIKNEETLFLDGNVSLYKKQGGKELIKEKTIRQLKQEQMELWELIEETIKSADKDVEIPDGRVYKPDEADDTRWAIYITYETGNFLNIEKGRKGSRGYDWTGKYYYNIELKGQHPDTISIRFTDYSKVSLFEEFAGKQHVHPVTIPNGLKEYFEQL